MNPSCGFNVFNILTRIKHNLPMAKKTKSLNNGIFIEFYNIYRFSYTNASLFCTDQTVQCRQNTIYFKYDQYDCSQTMFFKSYTAVA